jgi:hypothetical protein
LFAVAEGSLPIHRGEFARVEIKVERITIPCMSCYNSLIEGMGMKFSGRGKIKEENRMHRNPYPDDPIDAQPTEAVPPMEELQPRPVVHVDHTHEEVAPLEEAEVVEVRPGEARTAAFAIGKLNDFLQWLAVVLEIGLLLRFILRLIGANSGNPFAGFLYALTGIVLYPFATIVPSASIRPPDQAFEWSTLIAMLVYWLIFYAIRWFLRILITSPEPAE